MKNLDYFFDFQDLSNRKTKGLVRVLGSNPPEENWYKVFIDDQALRHRHTQSIRPEIIDLIDLAVAIYVADRVVKRSEDRRYNIHLVLPIRCPDIFNQFAVHDSLQRSLTWYTEDNWTVEFTGRKSSGRFSEMSVPLPLNGVYKAHDIETALWSGGLDALAGLCNRLKSGFSENFLLCGTGSNANIHKIQKRVHKEVENSVCKGAELMQVKYGVGELTKPLPDEQTLRARGFTFVLIGAACASLRDNLSLYAYENGIGAINLPFRLSEVGLDHARSVHPLSLAYISDLVSLVLNDNFEIINPFLFRTKAQMCQVFKTHDLSFIVPLTISCDRPRRERHAKQCGRCSSCILRRQALSVLGIREDTTYIYDDFDLHHEIVRLGEDDHLPAVLEQVRTMRTALTSPNPWGKLAESHLLQAVIESFTLKNQGALNEITDGLIKLYSNYVAEWDAISV